MIRNGLNSGQFDLFIGVADGEYAGFVITEVVPSLKGDWINIAFAHGRKKKMTLYGIKKIESMAKELGYRGVKVFSARKGMKRLLESNGFTQRFVEYVKYEEEIE